MSDTLIGIVGILVFLTLFMPRRYFTNFVGWLAILILIVLTYGYHQPGLADYGVGHTLGLFTFFKILAIIGLVVVLRLAAYHVFGRWQGGPVAAQGEGENPPLHAVMTKVQLLCAGSMAALVAFLIARSLLASTIPSWLAHMIAVAAIAGLWAIPLLSYLLPNFPSGWATGSKGSATTAFRWSITALVAASVAMPVLVAKRAQVLAGESPYCIQVADNGRGLGNYKEAGALLDLSGLTMKGGRQRHALLFVEEGQKVRAYHWSYRTQSFVDEVVYSKNKPSPFSAILCSPQTDFVEQLPLLFAEEADDIYTWIHGRAYRIPLTYRPTVLGGHSPSLLLRGVSGLIRGDNARTMPNEQIGQYADEVIVWLNPQKDLLQMRLRSQAEIGLFVEEGEELGLTRVVITGRTSSDQGQHDPRNKYTLYYLLGPDNKITSLIDCRSTRCTQEFFHAGLLFRFVHSQAELTDWREMQLRLIGLLESFAVQEIPDNAE